MTHCTAMDLSDIQMAFNRLVLSSNLRRPIFSNALERLVVPLRRNRFEHLQTRACLAGMGSGKVPENRSWVTFLA
jgi:hypothetical protein